MRPGCLFGGVFAHQGWVPLGSSTGSRRFAMKVLLVGTAFLIWTIPAFGQTLSPSANCQPGAGIPGYVPPGVPTSIELYSLSQLPSAPSYGTPPRVAPAPSSNFGPPPSFAGIGATPGAASGIGSIGTSGVGSLGTGVAGMRASGIGSIGSSGIGVPTASLSPPSSFVPWTPVPTARATTRGRHVYTSPGHAWGGPCQAPRGRN
jgi:hypothetical protein